MRSEFNNWLIENKPHLTRPDKYSGNIVTIANHIKKRQLAHSSFFSILDADKLNSLRVIYFNNQEFFLKNKTGNSMYSRTFDLYIEFIKDQYENLFINEELNKIRTDPNLSPTTKQSLILSRSGQGKYRAELISLWKRCCISRYEDIRLLTASHIKPWKVSNNTERLDPYNGFLLLPNFDKLFDRGLITFNNTGRINISKQIVDPEKLNIHDKIKINISKEHCYYLDYHRNNLFIG